MLVQSVLPYADQRDRRKAMAFCGFHLVQVSTILSTTTKSGTIKKFLIAASSVALHYQNLDLFLNEHGQDTQCIKNVLSEFKRWESISNHIEPVAVKMVLHMLKT